MIDDLTLDRHLHWWFKEYGPGGLPCGRSFNLIEALMAHKGFIPSASGRVDVTLNTKADLIEEAVVDMETMPGTAGLPNMCFRWAKVLRINYQLAPALRENDRRWALGEIGIRLTRYGYGKSLIFGRCFLAGYLTAVELERRHLLSADGCARTRTLAQCP